MHNTRKNAFTRKGNEAPAGQTSCHSESMKEKMPSPLVTLEVTHGLSNLASSAAAMPPSGTANDPHYSSDSQPRMLLVLWCQWRVSSYSFGGHLEMLPSSILRLYIVQLQIFQLYLEANRRNLTTGYLALLLSSAPPALLPVKQPNNSTVAFGAKKEHYSRP